MEYLHLLSGPSRGQKVVLGGKATLVFGRNAECDVIIPDPAVSRMHAQITHSKGKYSIEDLKSRNCTLVNGQAITTRTLLHDQDRVQICNFLFTFHSDREATPALHLPPRPEAEDDAESSSTIEVVLGDSGPQILQNQPARKLSLLLEITRKLARLIQLDQFLPEIIDSLFELFKQADRGVILLLDDQAQQLVPSLVKTRHGREQGPPRYSRRIVAQCLETGHALLSKDALREPKFQADEPDNSILAAQIRSVMCVPLLARDTGTAFGVLQLDTQDRAKKFTREDLELLMAVASQVSIAIENARLYQDRYFRDQKDREMALARQMQNSILPDTLPVLGGYEFFAHYASALEVGGDYYDFVPLPDGRLVVAIADVVGKGMPAALLMAKLSSDARLCLLSEKSPEMAVSRLNHLLLPACQQTDRFVTLALAVLAPARQTATLVTAGHLTPLVYRAARRTLEDAHPREVAGLPLGIQKDVVYSSRDIPVQAGDGLIFFTDGVVDAMDQSGKPFQMGRVRDILENGPLVPQAMGERLVAAVKQHSHGCKQQDDITVVCFGKT
jgi:serine phosphatase RsbU (regulator of sigma subunit)/pSer/pThr/pTyr-binding forkhead associated (FHA) protein